VPLLHEINSVEFWENYQSCYDIIVCCLHKV
jgi:hypothetical protein